MDPREHNARMDVLTFQSLASRSLANIDAVIYALTVSDNIVSQALVNRKEQAAFLYELYEGVIQLAKRLEGGWQEALASTRSSSMFVADVQQQNKKLAYEEFLRQTEGVLGK